MAKLSSHQMIDMRTKALGVDYQGKDEHGIHQHRSQPHRQHGIRQPGDRNIANGTAMGATHIAPRPILASIMASIIMEATRVATSTAMAIISMATTSSETTCIPTSAKSTTATTTTTTTTRTTSSSSTSISNVRRNPTCRSGNLTRLPEHPLPFAPIHLSLKISILGLVLLSVTSGRDQMGSLSRSGLGVGGTGRTFEDERHQRGHLHFAIWQWNVIGKGCKPNIGVWVSNLSMYTGSAANGRIMPGIMRQI